MEQTRSRTTTNTRTLKLVYGALFIALGIILKYFEISVTPSFRISLTTIPTMLSGVILGPVWGFSVGLLSDIIQYFIKSDGGAFNIGFTLTSALYGLIPGLFAVYLKKKNKEIGKKEIIIIVCVCQVICSVVLNTLLLAWMYGNGIFATVPVRVFKALMIGVIDCIVLYFLHKQLKNKIKF